MITFLENTIGPLYARLFATPLLYPIHKALFHLSLRGMGLFNTTRKSSGEDYFIKTLLPDLIENKSPILLDVGANIGIYSRMLRQHFPAAIIHAVEPHPANFRKLEERKDDSTHFHNMALGSTSGEIMLYDRADLNGSTHASVYKEVITEWHQQEETHTNVAVQTLDNFAASMDIEHIDFLKIDTEGHEYDVLAGARHLLSQQRISIIQFEFGCLHCYSHHFLNDFAKLLPNYTLYRLLPRKLFRLDRPPVETELFGHQNIVAIPSTLTDRIN